MAVEPAAAHLGATCADFTASSGRVLHDFLPKDETKWGAQTTSVFVGQAPRKSQIQQRGIESNRGAQFHGKARVG